MLAPPFLYGRFSRYSPFYPYFMVSMAEKWRKPEGELIISYTQVL